MHATLEPGLPANGPLAVHLHTGHPTPWTEGCVVRFSTDSAESWVGNFQQGYGYATKIIAWDEARACIVIAKGAAYFVRPENPADWRFFDDLGIDCILAPSRDVALLTTFRDVVAISNTGIELWRRHVANDGVVIENIEHGLIQGIAGIDPPDEWWPFTIRLRDGADAADD